MRTTFLLLSIAACGGAPAPKPAEVASNGALDVSTPQSSLKAAPKPVATEAPKPKEAPKGLPASCASEGDVCTPDAEFASRMCGANYPDAALVLFAKSSPFTRLYLRGDVDGWNADGGMTTRAKLVFDEEVLALKRRVPKTTGMVINGGGAGYLVMRWDGTCYTLEDGEITKRHPPVAKASPIVWKYLAPQTRDALLENARIKAAYERRGKECKGVSKACELADLELGKTIVSEIRAGLTIPLPERLP